LAISFSNNLGEYSLARFRTKSAKYVENTLLVRLKILIIDEELSIEVYPKRAVVPEVFTVEGFYV
jgi:hypothetical protein